MRDTMTELLDLARQWREATDTMRRRELAIMAERDGLAPVLAKTVERFSDARVTRRP